MTSYRNENETEWANQFSGKLSYNSPQNAAVSGLGRLAPENVVLQKVFDNLFAKLEETNKQVSFLEDRLAFVLKPTMYKLQNEDKDPVQAFDDSSCSVLRSKIQTLEKSLTSLCMKIVDLQSRIDL